MVQEISLSLEETNKLRAQLGLKPLSDSKEEKPLIQPTVNKRKEFSIGQRARDIIAGVVDDVDVEELLIEHDSKRQKNEDFQVTEAAAELIATGEEVTLVLQDQEILDKQGKVANVAPVLDVDLGTKNKKGPKRTRALLSCEDDIDEEERELLLSKQSAYAEYDNWIANNNNDVISLNNVRVEEKPKTSQPDSSLTSQPRVAGDFMTAQEAAKLFKKKKNKVGRKSVNLLPQHKQLAIEDLDDDEEDEQLYNMLSHRKPAVGLELADVPDQHECIQPIEGDATESSGVVELTTTSEFCRTLDIAAEKKGRFDRIKQKWRQMEDIDQVKDDSVEVPLSHTSNLDPEPVLPEEKLDDGMASALALLRQRKIIDEESAKKVSEEIIIEHRDEFGRVLDPKEAFRRLSWEFHGKKPGPKKRAKLLARVELERRKAKLLTQPEKLSTWTALKQSQREGKAFVVLSNDSSLPTSSSS